MTRKTTGLPKEFTDLIGTEQIFTGDVFSSSADRTVKMSCVIHGVRWGSSTIVNLDTLEEIHPTVQLLLSHSSKRRKQWSRPFPVRSIRLNTEENKTPE